MTSEPEEQLEGIRRGVNSVDLTEEDKEDTAQDSWFHIWRKGRKPDNSKAEKSWLWRSGRNAALNKARKNKRLDKIEDSHHVRRTAARPVEQTYDGNEARNHLRDSIDLLPKRQQEVLSLKADGYSNKEIAEELGINVSAVSSRLSRGLKKLRKMK